MGSEQHESTVSRRGFLTGSLTAASCLALAGFAGTAAPTQAWAEADGGIEPNNSSGKTLVDQPQYSFEYIPAPIDESQITETVDCEVVVVGAGVASMGATMYLASKGVDVQVVEKGPHEGVHRVCIAGVNSQTAKMMGLPELDPKEFAEDMWRYGGHVQANFKNLSRYAKDSGLWVDFVQSEIAKSGWTLLPMGGGKTEGSIWNEFAHGFIFQNEKGESLMTGVSPNWVRKFYEISEGYGAVFNFNEPAVYLEREGEMEGRCTAVITRHAQTGAYRRFRASKGIVLAAGDYFNDKELVHRYARPLEKCIVSICEPNNTGDMHRAALWIGADMDDYGAGDLFGFQNELCDEYLAPDYDDPNFNPMHETVRGCLWTPAMASIPLLWVDDAGNRFMNEATNGAIQSISHNVLANPNGMAWTIYDAATWDNLPADYQALAATGSASNFGVNTKENVEREVELGLVRKFDTLDEMIEGCGFDRDTFMETVERYNKLCAEGFDNDCYKDAQWMVPVSTGPFYAAHWGVMITSTRCGLKTDEHARVVDTHGVAIPGLYAAGNNGGRFYGSSYPGSFLGCGIGHGQFFAFTAARDILGEDVINTEELIEAVASAAPQAPNATPAA